MAAEAPSLPLQIKRDVRDNEEKKNKMLADATTTLGHPVTFNFDLPHTYAHLTGSTYQARIVLISLNYLENVIKALDKAYKDALIKQELQAAWTTHNIALVVLPTDKELEELKADKSTIGGSYFRLRLHAGELQVVTNNKYFNSNLNDIAALDLTPLASAAAAQSSAGTPGAPEELPLEIRLKMRDVQAKVDASLGNIRKLKGVEDASFNVDQQTRACYPKLKHITSQSTSFSPEAFPLYAATQTLAYMLCIQDCASPRHIPACSSVCVDFTLSYLDQLTALLTKQWKDDMVSEAMLEEWKAPHVIELEPETDLENEKSAKVVKDGRYNGIKLEGGKLVLLQGKGMWKTNMNNIANLDVVKMF